MKGWAYPIVQLVAPAFIANVSTLLYASPFVPGQQGMTWLSTIWIANVTAADATVILNLVPSGGSVAASNRILGELIIKANTSTFPPPYFIQTADGDIPLKVIPAGSSLYASCNSANTITCTIDGAEISG